MKLRREGRNLENMVLTAEGKKEMDGHPFKSLTEVENVIKSNWAIGYFYHFMNTI